MSSILIRDLREYKMLRSYLCDQYGSFAPTKQLRSTKLIPSGQTIALEQLRRVVSSGECVGVSFVHNGDRHKYKKFKASVRSLVESPPLEVVNSFTVNLQSQVAFNSLCKILNDSVGSRNWKATKGIRKWFDSNTGTKSVKIRTFVKPSDELRTYLSLL